MTTATLDRPKAPSPQPPAPSPEDDGYPVRLIAGVPYSTKPYAEDARPLYWNPLYPGCEMSWRSETKNERGFHPIIQKEAWTDGQFRPRNDWEREMTRNWMRQTLEGCNDPDAWSGVNHPEGPDAEWRCECTWHCGNYRAFSAHLRHLYHVESRVR